MENLKDAIAYGLSKNVYKDLKPYQGTVIEQYMSGKDVLFCSPTGSGISLSFEIAPFLFQYLEHKQAECTCIVVSPLAALMKAQVQELNKCGIKALYLMDSETQSQPHRSEVNDAANGYYELIFSSPETLLQGSRDLVMSLSKKGYLKVIFIDEAHCVKKFGRANTGSKSFPYRPFYGALGELRSLSGPRVHVVALTAKASQQVREMITKDLCMNKNVFYLSANPNKTNIKYWVLETPRARGDINKDFNWLVDFLRTEGINTPRMIVFFRKIEHIADVYEHLKTLLGRSAYVNYDVTKANDDRNRLFDMYHLKTDEEVKESIASSYQIPDGHTRVVLCSTAFIMGLDVKGVNTVIHYGASNDLDDYLQESGRAGRKHNEKCHSIVIKYKMCLSSKNITKDRKEFIKTGSCRRKVLINPFTEENTIIEDHDCCDNFAAKCACLCFCTSSEMCCCESKCPQNASSVYDRMKLFIQKILMLMILMISVKGMTVIVTLMNTSRENLLIWTTHQMKINETYSTKI
ncbi:uncharacterized protein LOC123534475 [Mercenaria mercenaria]|uniref:uncharacterized protein LOC123534475 n=1 Tax=Mercenaria mercenaria TaxID=6596 RepID=UPI00234ECB49|nr:uncharacterized protein LOC123534475 [Mercenaria mercenaria]